MTQAINDTVKGVTLGDPDGPMRFIPQFGFEVPTYIDSREDLIPAHAKGKFKRLDFHVPFSYRGHFRPEVWPEQYRQHVQYRTDMAGYVMCEALSASTGERCKSRGVNRMQTCRNHGALHPADKKISGSTLVGDSGMPMDRINKLDRVQKFMQGLITPEELDDDEVKNRFVRDNNGMPVKTVKLGAKFEAILHKEMLRRLNEYLHSKAPRAIEVIYEIADSEVYEAQDRFRASQWLAERVIGKTPDVLVSLDAKDTPFSSILANVESGSRSDYRKNIAIERGESFDTDNGSFVDDTSVLDAEVVDDDEELSEDEEEDIEEESALVFVENAEQRKADIKEARERIKKAKARRYAARATGATSLDSMPFLLKYSPNKAEGGWRMKLIPSSTASPAVVDKLIG